MSTCEHCDPPRHATHRVELPPKKGLGGIRYGEPLVYDVCEACSETYEERYIERIPYYKCSICGCDIERFDVPLCEPCEGSAKAHARLDREAAEYREAAKEWDRRLS